jgi:DNA-binding transcriptional regulator of glucitol operon
MSQKLYFNILWKLKYKLFIYQYLNICSQELGRISLKNATKNFMKEIREKLKSRLKKKSLSINFRHWSHSDPLISWKW